MRLTSAPVTNELMYEVLKKIQANVAVTCEDIASMKARITSLDTRLGVVHTDMTLRQIEWTASRSALDASRRGLI